MVFIPDVYLENIIGIFLKNMPLGTPQPLYNLCIVTYVVHIQFFHSLATHIS